MKRLIEKLVVVGVVFLLAVLIPKRSYADLGPKPQVKVKIENYGDETVYATLISFGKEEISPVTQGDYPNVPKEIKSKFADYVSSQKKRGKFINDIWIINDDDNVLNCGYMPPSCFEVVVYIPSKDKFINTYAYNRYAFISSYILDISIVDANGSYFLRRKDYGFWGLLLKATFFIRLFVTVIIEAAVALMFKISGKKSMIVIVVTNIITQVLLNVALAAEKYSNGKGLGLLAVFVSLELAIIVVEAIVYSIALKSTNPTRVSTGRAIAYSLVANLFTALLGIGV